MEKDYGLKELLRAIRTHKEKIKLHTERLEELKTELANRGLPA